MISRSTQIVKQLLLTGSIAAALAMSACKSESAPQSPEKKDSLDSKADKKLATEDDPAPAGPDSETPDGAEATSSAPLTLTVSSASALQVKIGTPVSITFNMAGADGKTVLVGLMSSPSGATISTSGTTVTYSWSTPTGGTYPIKFLMRDKAKCEAAESDSSACSISSSDTALKAKSYDVASEEFSLEVSTDDSLGLPGTTAGNNVGSGNDQLIQQIVGLLGGGGGGGIQSLLQGLGTGQLQTILGQLQNGGGGGGIGQLIGLLGNL